MKGSDYEADELFVKSHSKNFFNSKGWSSERDSSKGKGKSLVDRNPSIRRKFSVTITKYEHYKAEYPKLKNKGKDDCWNRAENIKAQAPPASPIDKERPTLFCTVIAQTSMVRPCSSRAWKSFDSVLQQGAVMNFDE